MTDPNLIDVMNKLDAVESHIQFVVAMIVVAMIIVSFLALCVIEADGPND